MYDMDTDYILWDFTPKKPAKSSDLEPQKGVCSKCGEHVGRGVFFHEKACHGPAKAE